MCIPEIPFFKIIRHRFCEIVIGADRIDNNINRLENLKDAYIISNGVNCKAISVLKQLLEINRLAPIDGSEATGQPNEWTSSHTG